MLDRRRFLVHGSLALAATTALSGTEPKPAPVDDGWDAVRRQFELDPRFVHLGLFYMTAHPRPVREAIEGYRRALDSNPFITVEHGMFGPPDDHLPTKVYNAIARYTNVKPDEIALTQNTTAGLALIYHGLPLKSGDEVLTTTHDHMVHHESIRLACERNGATWRKIALFDSPQTIDADQMVERIRKGITAKTRVVGVTWVHSSTGLKLPIARIAEVVKAANANRAAKDRVLLVVDGVHGIGVEDPDLTKLGADAFSAGTHKWIFGPRGTGFVWAKPQVWATMRPLIPSFTSFELFTGWAAEKPPAGPPKAEWFTPGGFWAFEHYWALPAAFDFHRAIGPAKITSRIHQLNGMAREALAKLPNVVMHTPAPESLRAGMVCFDVNGVQPQAVVQQLHEKEHILASTTPYAKPYARVAFGITNSEAEVEKLVHAVSGLR